MADLAPLNAEQPIVDSNGLMNRQMRVFQNKVATFDFFVGSGSPEGVVSAEVGRRYIDQTGAPGSVQYVKQLSDIGGDPTLGWSL